MYNISHLLKRDVDSVELELPICIALPRFCDLVLPLPPQMPGAALRQCMACLAPKYILVSYN